MFNKKCPYHEKCELYDSKGVCCNDKNFLIKPDGGFYCGKAREFATKKML